MTTTACSTDALPVPLEALYELGLDDEQIAQAVESRPLVVANQAGGQPGAWFDVAAA